VEWWLWSVHFTLSLPILLPQGEDSPQLFPFSKVGSLSRETVVQKILQRESFPQGAVLQEQAAPTWVPHRVTSPANKTAPAWAPFSPRVYRSWQEPAPARASHWVTASFGHPPALVWGPPWAAGGYLLYCGPPLTVGGQPFSPSSFTAICKGDLCSGA